MDKQDKRNNILSAAEKLFSELGYEGTSIRLIGKEAEANLSMISYYFGSKEGVFLEIVISRFKGFNAKLKAIAEEPISSAEKMRRIIEIYARNILSGTSFHKIMHRELTLEQRPELSLKIKEAITANLQVVEQIIENAVANSEFRVVDARMIIASIIGTISHIATTPAKLLVCDLPLRGKPEEIEMVTLRVIKHLQDLIITYLTPLK